MGSGNSVVRAEVSYAAGQATSASLYFAAAPYYDPSGGDPSGGDPSGGGSSSGDPSTEWSYSRSETLASISNLSAGGSMDMSTGETRSINGEVRHEVWDIWVNGYGMEDRRYNYAGPAAWATVTAAIEFGDGSLGSTTVTSDGQGWFSLDYTMGSSSSRVTVSADGATSASGTNGSASVDFSFSSTTGQPEYGNGYDNGGTSSPSLLSYDGSYRIEGPHSDGPTYDLTPGTQRTVSGVLYWDSWEVWSDGSGNTTIQNHQSYPVTWSGLTLSLAQGDGTIADSSITTDSSGGFSTTFTMGNVASRVRVEATGGSSGSVTAELDFTPPPAGPVDDFVKVREESSLFVALTSGTPQAGTEAIPLEAQVTETTWEVWENGIAPAELRNYRTGPAIAASVEFSIVSGSGNLTAIDSLTDADGTARASIIPGQADTVVAANASFLTTGASGQITVSPVPWVHQSTESRLVLSLQQQDISLTATVRLQTWQIWVDPATGLGEIRHESEGPAANAEVIFQSLGTSGYDASFYTPTVMTATDGTASTTYTSLDGTMAQVTANFAGQSVTETIQLPTASGSNGTGTWNGTDWNGGSGGGGSGGGGTGGGGTGGGGSGGGGSDVTATRIPVNLRGRYHQTSGGSGTPSSEATDNPDEGKDTLVTGEGPDLAPYHELLQLNYSDARYDEVTLYERFEATLVRDVLANDGVTVTGEEEKEVEGLVVDKEEILAPDLEDRWRVRDEEEFDPYQGYRWEVSFASSINYNTSDSDATGEALEVNGRTSPSSDASLLTTLASEHEIKSLYEQVGSPPDPTVYWNGSVGDMGFGAAPWSSSERLEEGGSTNSPTASELESYADFVSGVTPSVKWSEYWGQTDAPVPADGGPAKSTVVFFAKSINEDGETTSTGTVTVTFTIDPGQRVSTDTPVIESSSGSMGSWIVAQSDGTVRAEPPVERGKRNAVSALAVEFEDEEPYSGFDDITPDEGPWLMVPHGDENKLIAITGATTTFPIEFEARPKGQAYIVPDPSSVSSPREKLKFVGGAIGDGEFLVPGMRGQFAETSVLRFAVYLERELDVTVHMIAKATPGESVRSPVNQFTESELSDFLNRIYKDQANIKINLTLKNEVPVDYDISDHNDFWSDEGQINARNGIFDIRYNEGTSLEEQAILQASPESPNSINIYVVGSDYISPVAHRTYQGRYLGGSHGELSGLARISERRVWIDSGDFQVGTVDFNQPNDEVMQTIAHEIGHILIGAGHADQPNDVVVYPCIVPNTDPAIRLMVSGDGQEEGKVSRTLLKCEWDKISEFFAP